MYTLLSIIVAFTAVFCGYGTDKQDITFHFDSLVVSSKACYDAMLMFENSYAFIEECSMADQNYVTNAAQKFLEQYNSLAIVHEKIKKMLLHTDENSRNKTKNLYYRCVHPLIGDIMHSVIHEQYIHKAQELLTSHAHLEYIHTNLPADIFDTTYQPMIETVIEKKSPSSDIADNSNTSDVVIEYFVMKYPEKPHYYRYQKSNKKK